ncbi:MAG: ABC transporter substrate-binding protein [Erysipelotrichaceae bacterium]|nr:ABC transporter substrate-binding protein [Erysipelotrichaceae bacterium]
MKKASYLIIAVCLVFTSLFGCSKTSKDDALFNENDPIIVVDGSGRRVSFAEPAKTVATSWGGGVDMYIYALGVGDRLVATNSKHNIDRLFFNPDEMPKVGRWVLDKEALADIQPDVYLHGSYATDQITGANSVKVRAYGMGFHSFDDIAKNITDLGKIFGVEERAAYVNSYCENILKLVKDRVSSIPKDQYPTVIILGEQIGELAADIYDTIDIMIEMAGGKSMTPDELATKTETTVVGLEKIFEWNPDFIFLQDYYCELTVEDIMSSSTWAPMTSVKNNHVFAIPSEIDAWSKGNPSCYIGTLYISMQMYPDLYTDIDINKLAVEFYHEVYGLDLTLEQIGIH